MRHASELRAQAAFDELNRVMDKERERIAKDMGIELSALLVVEAKEKIEEGVFNFTYSQKCFPLASPIQILGLAKYVENAVAADMLQMRLMAAQQSQSRLLIPR